MISNNCIVMIFSINIYSVSELCACVSQRSTAHFFSVSSTRWHSASSSGGVSVQWVGGQPCSMAAFQRVMLKISTDGSLPALRKTEPNHCSQQCFHVCLSGEERGRDDIMCIIFIHVTKWPHGQSGVIWTALHWLLLVMLRCDDEYFFKMSRLPGTDGTPLSGCHWL